MNCPVFSAPASGARRARRGLIKSKTKSGFNPNSYYSLFGQLESLNFNLFVARKMVE